MSNEIERAFGPENTSDGDGGDQDTSDWSTRVARNVAVQIRFWRERRGYSAKQLSDRTADLGHRIPRAVIANLENQRRDTVGVAELLVIAGALDVPPTMLITPVGREEVVEILPGLETPPWLARGWILGARHPSYKSFSNAGWQDARRPIALYDIHRLLVIEHQQIQTRIRRLVEHDQLETDDMASLTAGRRGRESLLAHAVQELAYSMDRLRQHRELIAAEGFRLPVLPPGLAVNLRGSESAGRHQAQSSEDEESDLMLPPVLFDLLRGMKRSGESAG